MTTVFSSAQEVLEAVGKDLGATEWVELTQERVNKFADATDDHQWIHVDPERAKTGPFGACVAHGYLTLSLVNLFLQSSAMAFALSVVGVLVFTGLTAYDTQKIKEMYYEADDTATMGRKAVMGALTLYLDFINLFLSLLRLFGDRR